MLFRRRRPPAPDPSAVGDDDPRRAVIRHRGRDLTFAIDNPSDIVQKHLKRGAFYEAGLLRSHGDLIYWRSTVLDVGANVGNHSVFYALTPAAKVYPFEPNPRARELLTTTVGMNDLDEIDLTYVDRGLGAAPGEMFVHTPVWHNLGRTWLSTTGEIKVSVSRLDDLAIDGPVSFVKIDVEGMELDVLAGGEALIEEHRPGLGVEVNLEHLAEFWQWVEAHRYHVVRANRDHAENINYVCVPRF